MEVIERAFLLFAGTKQVHGEVPDEDDVVGGVLFTVLVAVLFKGHVELVLEAVLDPSVCSDVSIRLLGAQDSRANVVADLLCDDASGFVFATRLKANECRQPRPLFGLGHTVATVMQNVHGAGFDAAMTCIGALIDNVSRCTSTSTEGSGHSGTTDLHRSSQSSPNAKQTSRPE